MKRKLLSAGAFTILLSVKTQACMYHWMLGLPEPTGVWLTDPTAAAGQVQLQDSVDDAAITNAIVSGQAQAHAVTTATATLDPTITNWLINTTGVKGKSTDATVNSYVSQVLANVQEVAYTSTDTYVKVTGIPDYDVGPFGNDPNEPANANATFDISRNPTPASTKTATGGGAIGVLVNGVAVFNAWDGTSYKNQNIWLPNAGVAEAQSFDSANGHPQQQGVYHNHESPVSLIAELGATTLSPNKASPLLGYAIDGYPIYGDYEAVTPGGPIVHMTSSYELRSITNRETTTDGGATLPSNEWGPAISSTYPLGYYQQDYKYVSGLGMCDQYNGAFVYTPEYPNGTYAYFATVDNSGNPAYPYFVGPDYYGVVSTDDLPNGTVTVPANATVYTAPEPTSLLACVGLLSLLARRRAR